MQAVPSRDEVNGTVASGFEPVAAQLAKLIADGEERGCSVAAYVHGRPVVDIWAGLADNGPWTADTFGLTYSVTKGASALCIQVLCDRGAIDVDAPVARYWPEYAAAGKGSTLVRHILNHTAAQFTYPGYWRDIGPDRRAITDQDLIAARLAAARPAWKPGTTPMYHALTYGHLIGELVRRVDGRSLGRFFREEIAEPLKLDFWIGLPGELQSRVARPLADNPLTGRRRAHRGRTLGAARSRVRADDVFHPAAWPYSLILTHPDVDDPLDLSFLGQQPWGYSAELPASNGTGTARSLARMYSMLAEGGELDGTRIVSRGVIRRFSDAREGRGGGFALGYVVLPAFLQSMGIGRGSFGSAGAGGSLVVADPANRVSFALTKNQMRDSPAAGLRLLLTLYRCLAQSNRATTLRRAAATGVISNRRVFTGAMNGLQWLQTFRSPERSFPMAHR
jgi:CubicO group peptidase (beta-lactamase class C family)